jgi:hypothetical protein
LKCAYKESLIWHLLSFKKRTENPFLKNLNYSIVLVVLTGDYVICKWWKLFYKLSLISNLFIIFYKPYIEVLNCPPNVLIALISMKNI